MKGNLNNQPNKTYAKLDERFDTDPLEAKIEQTFLARILLIDTEKTFLGG